MHFSDLLLAFYRYWVLVEAILVVCVLFVFLHYGLQTGAGLVQGGVILAHLCITIVFVKIDTVNTFVVVW